MTKEDILELEFLEFVKDYDYVCEMMANYGEYEWCEQHCTSDGVNRECIRKMIDVKYNSQEN